MFIIIDVMAGDIKSGSSSVCNDFLLLADMQYTVRV